jgi:peptide/nickel transport system permease protein
MRGNLLDVLGEEYVRTARAKGLPETVVIYRHAVRNALNPMITILGFEFAGLLSGFAIIENIVSWPGLGQMMLDALLKQDVNLAMAGLMIGAIMLLLGNLLADVLLAFSDPRIKLEA